MGSSFHSVSAANANEQSPKVAEVLIVGHWRKSFKIMITILGVVLFINFNTDLCVLTNSPVY